MIISHFQMRPLLRHRGALGERVALSTDLGLSTVEAVIEKDGLRLPAGDLLSWGALQEVVASENNCFTLAGGMLSKVVAFSESTNRVYSLMPTSGAPTMLISGIPMHRIKGTTPERDTQKKIAAIDPLVGRVLDTATGLGYTAIAAARKADRVVTVELDPVVLGVARQNPWSRELFDNPKIDQQIGDSGDVVETLEDNSFARIVHDPPTFSLAGHLYSGEFYTQLYRVLQAGGRLYHYIGDPDSRLGSKTTRGVIRRLEEAGFSRIRRRANAFGVLAHKGG
jgi:predicted methyltransferase